MGYSRTTAAGKKIIKMNWKSMRFPLKNPLEMGEGQNFLSQAANDNTPKNNNQQHKILITLCGLVKMTADS